MVSVLLLSWNHEAYIDQALLSIINQSYKDIEIIYADNASSDNTFCKAENILQQYHIPYKKFKREKNYHTAQNLNYLFNQSQGEFICPMSADDWLHKSNIEEKIKILQNDTSIGMADSNGYFYYEDVNIFAPFKCNSQKENQFQELLENNFISGVGCLLKRETLETIGLWDESLKIEDWDLWIRIAEKYKIACVDKHLFFYRKHTNAISANYTFMKDGKMQIFNKYKHLNNQLHISLQKIKENYLSNKIMKESSIKLFFEVMKSPGLNNFFLMLLKSLIPVWVKQKQFKKSLIKKYKNIKPIS